ncbi:hypothetical protein K438DRAFT_1797199 [Mycena galopus ATCC 62051]|nr:hypothetical protein K438DRAFT_1797199 [Mycena galopus ATCC 62051]
MTTHQVTPRTPRNIDALPTEILAIIFQLACATPKIQSHVCHLWRRVALGSPQLWTDAIDYEHDHPDFVKEQLRRSANMSVALKARFPMHSNRGMKNLHLALKESAGIHTLDIEGPPEILDQVLQNLDATFVRTLSLFVPWEQMPKAIPYPGPSFQLNAPRLRTLSLSNFVIPWDATVFNSLTHLRLHLQDATFAPSMTQILAMLASSPMLTELNLLHAIETSSRLHEHEPIGVVPLPHLAVFLLDDDILNHIFVLRHIEVPADCTFTLKVEHRVQNTLTELGRSVSVHLPLGKLTKLDVEGDPSRVAIRGYPATSPSNALIQIILRCPGGYSEMGTVSVAATLLGPLPLAATTTLELAFSDPHSATIPVEAWQMCLRNLEAVESLQVKLATPCNLLSALSEQEDGAPVLLPRLQRFEVHHPDPSSDSGHRSAPRHCTGQHLGSWWQKIEVAQVTFLDTLLMCLKVRQHLGIELDTLRIVRCAQWSAHEKQKFDSVAKNVSWCPQ